MAKFRVGDRVRNKTAPEAGVGIVERVDEDGGLSVNYKDTWYSVCRDHEDKVELVKSAAPPPIRTITKREIVPGVYGTIRVGSHLSPGCIDIRVGAPGHTAADLREAADMFNELAAVLEENAV